MQASWSIVIVALILYLTWKWRSKKKESDVCLIGKTALVTGAARGKPLLNFIYSKDNSIYLITLMI